MFVRTIQKLLFLVCVFIVVACATEQTARFVSGVDSYANSNALDKKNYIIVPGNKNIEPSDLQFLENAGYVEKILGEKGFIKAKTYSDADVVIFLAYGIGNPQTHQYSYSLPVWGQTGVSSSSTYGNLYTYGNTGTYSGTTTYTPSYGITGSKSHIGSYTTYTRFLVLTAYDVEVQKRDGTVHQLWKTNVSSTGASGDLRRVFPYMTVAMKPYIGTNTKKNIRVELFGNDPQVSKLIETINPSPTTK